MRSNAPTELLRFLATLAAATALLLTASTAAHATPDPSRVPAIAGAKADRPAGGSDADDQALRKAGIGVSGGVVMLRLSADRALRAFGGSSGTELADQTPAGVASYDLHENLVEIAPSVHLGGDGFYFKVEAPLRQSATMRSYGAGIYPLNYGLLVPALHVMPTASAGVVLSYLADRRTDAVGPLFETRVAVGIKFFPTRGLALSLDIARTPWALGALRGRGPDWWQRPDARGGIGNGWDLGVGVSWL
jgi:hypothetical protein